eukprot:scaffold1754_cov355-Prasinococcus_capsulatus_cf.AAC.3
MQPVHLSRHVRSSLRRDTSEHGRACTTRISLRARRTEEAVGEEHLHLLVVGGKVAVWVVAIVLVGAAPLVARGRELVGRERARARREAAGDHDALLSIPALVPLQDLCVPRHVVWRQLWALVGLRMDPAQRLQVLEVLVLGQLLGEHNKLVRAALRRHHYAPDLLDLRVVRRGHAIQIARDLGAQVGDADELLEHVLGKDVCVTRLLDVVRVDVDVVHAQVQIRRGDGAHPPVRLGREDSLLVGARGRHYQFVAMDVGRAGRHSLQLRRLLGLLLDLRDLLPLLRRWRDLRAEDDVPDLRLRQCGHVHAVLLGVVAKDEILECYFHLDPLLVRQVGPNMVRLCDDRLVRLQQHLALVVVYVQSAQDQYQPREGRVGGHRLQPVVVDIEQHHLWLRGLEDQVTKLLDLHARLEGQLQLRPLDHDVGEGADQCGDLLGGLPLGQLAQTLLARPHARVDDLEEELAGARVEDEDGTVDGLGGQVALEGLVDGHAIHVGVIHEPDDLVAEQLPVVLRGQVRFRGL